MGDQYTEIVIQIMLDDRVMQNLKETYTVANALSGTGGFVKILDIIVLILIGGLQRKKFINSVIKNIYKDEKTEVISRSTSIDDKVKAKISPI